LLTTPKYHNLLLLWIAVLFITACHTKPSTTAIDTKAQQLLLLKNDSLLKKTTDTSQLVKLLEQRVIITDSLKQYKEWSATQLQLYAIKSDGDTNYTKGIEHLTAIVEREKMFGTNDSLKSFLAKAYGQRYYIYEQQNLNHKVIADCENYLKYSTPEIDKDYLSYVLNACGIAYSIIGDQQQAISKLEQLLKTNTADIDIEKKGQALVNLSNAYLNTGNFEKAIGIASDGLVFDLSSDHKASLHAIVAIGAMQQKKYDLAYNNCNQSIVILKNTEEYNRLGDLYNVLGDINAATNRLNKALENFTTAIQYRTIADSSLKTRDAGKTFIKIGGVYDLQKKYDSAIVYYHKALTSVCDKLTLQDSIYLPEEVSLYPENTIMEALDAMAITLQKQYDSTKKLVYLKNGLRCIEKAFSVENMLRQHFIFDDSKYNQVLESNKRCSRAIELCYTLFNSTKEPQWVEKGFEFAEQSKANVLIDKLKENTLLQKNDSTLVKTKLLFLNIEAIALQLQSLKKETNLNAILITSLEKEKLELEKEYAINQSSINAKIFESVAQFSKVTFSKIKSDLLKNNDCILEYHVSDSNLYAFTVHKKGIEFVKLNYDSINKTILTVLPFYNNVSSYNNNPNEFKKLSNLLYQKLLSPISATTTAIQNIIVVPDGILNQLPYETLLDEKNDYAILKYNFNYAFSCTALLQQAENKTPTKQYEALLFAPFTENSFRNFPQLPQSKNEVNAIKTNYKKALINTDKMAIVAEFKNKAPQARFIHLATHAVAQLNDSIASTIAFADDNISLKEIYGLQLNNELVVLSACETGVGKFMASEGNLSLARAFYYAGSKNVINSLWKVDDESSGKIFTEFYKNLNDNESVSAALHSAKINYLKTATKEKQSPYYWSTFVCIGSGKEHIKGSNYIIWYMLIGSIIVLFVAFYIYKRPLK
jgi:CHAT domain-containing protein/tetratricopeptide (TPR) repeat protein